jgi:hypothetical protein
MGRSPYTDSIRVGEWPLREIFNEGRYVERAEAGELRVEIKRSKPCLNSDTKNWIPGTLTQELRYYDSNNLLVAKAHRFLRPDGLLAASGKVDPKRVVKDNIMYILDLPEEAGEPLP